MPEKQLVEEDQGLEIICIGNALVDTFVKLDDARFRKFGITESCHIEYGKLLEILKSFPDYNAVSGGGAANVAKIAALLGIRAGYIGTVGPGDAFAKIFERDLSAAGVSLLITRVPQPTGACVFLQREGEPPVIAASVSAAASLKAKDVREDAIRTSRVAVIDGFILGRDALVNRILELAAEYGTVIALDVGSVEMAEAHARDIIRYCREYPLLLFMNLAEAKAFYRCLNHDSGEDAEENPGIMERLFARKNPLPQKIQTFLQKLANDLFPVIAVKLGAKGAMVFAGGKAHREDTLAVIPKETTGAGDAFCAAFLGAWLRNKSFSECAGFGNRTACEVLDVDGTFVDKKKLAALAKQLTG
jgi:sugar/nucleoside kinase (ribokinase family)